MNTLAMQIEESMLTGESKNTSKAIEKVNIEDAEITKKRNMLFSGTLVSKGKGIGIVTATAMNTEMGKIQAQMEEAAGEAEDTPLKLKIKEFGDQLAKIIGILCILIWVVNFPNFYDPAYASPIIGALAYFKIAVALAVAAIPEGLPAVITTCLALGTRKMAKKNAIVRKLPSVETLGCTTVICSDKTGTLTTNEMVVRKFAIFGQKLKDDIVIAKIEGVSYKPVGKISICETENSFTKYKNLYRFIECCAFNNESKIRKSKDDASRVDRSGLPTEAALRVMAEKFG